MIEFNLILRAVQPNISAGMFWRLLLGTVAMLAFGYAGEAHAIDATVGFVFGLSGWGFILYEIFMGEAGKVAGGGDKVNKFVQESFKTMRFIVTVWLVYLSFGLPLWVFDGCCRPLCSELDLQPCRLCEQDCFLLSYLVLCQEQHL